MKSLQLIDRIDTKEIYDEYLKNISLMKNQEGYFDVHSDAQYIHLVGSDTFLKHTNETDKERDVRDRLRVVKTGAAKLYPKTINALSHFAKKQNGHLSRTVITSIRNEYKDYPHIDCGYFYVFHDRYHLVLLSSGSHMKSGENDQVFRTGDIFYINNKVAHTGKHVSGNEERIHIFFDVLPKSALTILGMYFRWLFVYGATRDHMNYSLLKRIYGMRYCIYALWLTKVDYPRTHARK